MDDGERRRLQIRTGNGDRLRVRRAAIGAGEGDVPDCHAVGVGRAGSSVWIAATPDAAEVDRFTELPWLRSDREDTNAFRGRTGRFIPYDLHRQPQDLCLRLHGGSMLGGTWTSNTVRITAAELRAALGAAGP